MVCILLWIAWQCCVAIVEGNSDVRPPDTLDYDTLDHDNGDSNLEVRVGDNIGQHSYVVALLKD